MAETYRLETIADLMQMDSMGYETCYIVRILKNQALHLKTHVYPLAKPTHDHSWFARPLWLIWAAFITN